MKTTSNLFKYTLTLLAFLGWASFATGQTSPEITVKKKVNGSYEDNNLHGGTANILAGQKDTFKIVIQEPSQGNTEITDFFSHSGQLKVFLPDDAGAWDDELQFANIYGDGDNQNNIIFDGGNLNSDITLSTDSISFTKDTIYTDVEVDATYNNQDEIVIENLIIEFPDDLADGDDFELRAWADFMDTRGDDSSPLA